MPIINTTTNNSINVKPFCIEILLFKNYIYYIKKILLNPLSDGKITP